MDSLEIIENISESIIDFDLNLTDIDNSNDNYWLNQNPIYMLVIYICIGIIGVVGNIITCIVIATNKSMHTVTNCYLFNLAISDLLMIIFAFPAFDGYDRYSSKTVCFLRGFIAEASVYISVLTIVAFSIERYLAICHPFFVRALSHLSRASRTIPTIWILGCAGALPVAMQIGIIHDYRSKDRAICTVVTASGPFYLELSTVVFFILPMILMIWLYTLMGIKLRSSGRRLETRDGESRRTEEDARNNSNKRVLRMLGYIYKGLVSPFVQQSNY
ncbi:pyrokinin-1 receptor-like [Nasonia vitripennis]|uniref:G-protein coupled receptors family 1 profile domain-containing protein n=1 Tax=Nasonia vitripennis TaxID=7425 RepID=A0A7M7T6K5_NASVI|nr:pyrokinin-1 receptor-like [Nasonia vitripennis]